LDVRGDVICGEYPGEDDTDSDINNPLVTFLRTPFLKQYTIYYVWKY